jgi:AAA domain/CHC2 zinc finger
MSDAVDLDLVRKNGPLLRSVIGANVALRKQGKELKGLCPFHKERTPSFAVYDDGHFHCFGCGKHGTIIDWYKFRDHLEFPEARDKAFADLGIFDRPKPKANGHAHHIPLDREQDIATIYDYQAEDGAVVVQSIRTISGQPRFRQRHQDANGKWDWHGITDPPPYRLPALATLAKGSLVWICEGEKDADRLHDEQLIATTNIGGALSWRPEYANWFKGLRVVILEDNDKAGRDRTAKIKPSLEAIAASVTVLALPGLPEGGDVSDWLDAGHTVEELGTFVPPDVPLDKDGATVFVVEFFRDIRIVLQARDFVEGILIDGAMSVIYGESTSGKTFYATDLGLHIACGWEWNGRAVEQGGVIYLAFEGSHGIRNRVAAFREAHDLGGRDIPFAIIPVAMNLLDPEADTEKLIRTIKYVAASLLVPVRWVVGDTLSRAMAGGNENAPDDMGALVTNGTRIQQETGAAMGWVHHSGKDQAKGMRGHSLLRAATDTEIEVVADEEGQRTARVTKQRDMECIGEWPFRLKPVELGINGRGKPITSCIVDYGGNAAPRRGNVGGGSKAGGHAKRALEILTDLCASAGVVGFTGVPDSVSSVPEGWWRERFYDRAMPGDKEDTKKHAFGRASTQLINQHLVGMSNKRVWVVSRRQGEGS